MVFNFKDQYKDYSTADLLKIVKNPADYQSEAVDAATAILKNRNILPEELQAADEHLKNVELGKRLQKHRIESYKAKAADLFEPLLHPTEKVEPRKWLNLLLLAVTIQYTLVLYDTIKDISRFFRCDYCRFDINIAIDASNLIYIPLIFFLLYRKRRWGWIILFADNLIACLLAISQVPIFFEYQSIHHGDTLQFLLPILIRAGFAFFLWKESIAGYFGITKKTKANTTMVAASLALLFYMCVRLILI